MIAVVFRSVGRLLMGVGLGAAAFALVAGFLWLTGAIAIVPLPNENVTYAWIARRSLSGFPETLLSGVVLLWAILRPLVRVAGVLPSLLVMALVAVLLTRGYGLIWSPRIVTAGLVALVQGLLYLRTRDLWSAVGVGVGWQMAVQATLGGYDNGDGVDLLETILVPGERGEVSPLWSAGGDIEHSICAMLFLTVVALGIATFGRRQPLWDGRRVAPVVRDQEA